MTSIRLNFIQVPTTGNLFIRGSPVEVTNTTPSTSSISGSVNLAGGLSIKCTSDSNGITSGGALTIAGGISISKQTFLGNNVTLNNTSANFTIQGSTLPRLLVNSTSAILNNETTIFNSNNIQCNGTSSAVNSTSGSVVLVGGLASNSLFVQGNTILGNSTINNVTVTSDILLPNSSSKLVCTAGTGGNTVLFGANASGEAVISNLGTVFVSCGNFRVNDTFSVTSTGGSFTVPITVSNVSANNLSVSSIVSENISTSSVIFPTNTATKINFGNSSLGTTSSNTMVFSAGNYQFTGIVELSQDTVSFLTSNQSYSLVSGISSATLLSSNASFDFILSNANAIKITDLYLGKTGSNYLIGSTNSNLQVSRHLLLTTSGNSEFNSGIIFTSVGNASFPGNVTVGNIFYTKEINISTSNLISSYGSLFVNTPFSVTHTFTVADTNGNQLITSVSGTSSNINTTNQIISLWNNSVTFNSNGNAQFNGSISAGSITGGTGSLNTLNIASTIDAFSSVSTGSLTVAGGGSILKNLRVGGKATFLNTSGTVSIETLGTVNVLSTNVSDYGLGALTVAGGASIGGELYVGQNLNVLGQINGGGSSSSTFAYLTLTSTDPAVNETSGSLLTFGGIVTQCPENAVNVSNGGSFLSLGGASIAKDVYIGGNSYLYGTLNQFTDTNFFDISNIKRWSINGSNNFSISRYDSLGAFIENSIFANGSTGEITFNNTSNTSINTLGGVSIAKKLIAGNTTLGNLNTNDVVISSTTVSSNPTSGSLIVRGGAGIGGNLNVLGNTTIYGNLSIVGTTTSISSTTTLIEDNIIVLNAGPSGTLDSGFVVGRYQLPNDNSEGDVIADTAKITGSLPSQSAMTSTQVKFPVTVTTVAAGWWVEITSGFSASQVREITSYDSGTQIGVISTPWTDQNPNLSDTFALYNKPYVGIVYNEISDAIEFTGTLGEPGHTKTDLIDIKLNKATVSELNCSFGITSGSVVTTNITTSNLNLSGNLTIFGINATPNATDRLSTVTFTGANNVTNANVTGLVFDNSVWGFDIYISVRNIGTASFYSNYHLRGTNMGSSFQLVSNYIGDNPVTFSINSSGQVQYTSNDVPGFVSLTFKYKVVTN